MSGDEMTQASFEVDKQTYEAAKDKLKFGEMSKRLRETVHTIAHGAQSAEKERVKNNLEEWRDKRNSIDAEINKLKSERRDVERKISRAEDRLNELQEQNGEYDGTLAMLEQDIHEGKRVIPESKKVKEAARLGDCNPKDVIQDLKERNPEVPAEAYRLAKQGENGNWKKNRI